MLAAQAEERRRAEQVGAGQARLQLLERTQDRLALGPGDDDPHEVGVRRVAERLAALELLGEEPPDVVPRRVSDRAGVRLVRLHDHAARRVAPAATRRAG